MRDGERRVRVGGDGDGDDADGDAADAAVVAALTVLFIVQRVARVFNISVYNPSHPHSIPIPFISLPFPFHTPHIYTTLRSVITRTIHPTPAISVNCV